MQRGQHSGEIRDHRGVPFVGQGQGQPCLGQDGCRLGLAVKADQCRRQSRRPFAGLGFGTGKIGHNFGWVEPQRNILLAPCPQPVQPGPIRSRGQKPKVVGKLPFARPQPIPCHQIAGHRTGVRDQSLRPRPILGLHRNLGGGKGAGGGFLCGNRQGSGQGQPDEKGRKTRQGNTARFDFCRRVSQAARHATHKLGNRRKAV